MSYWALEFTSIWLSVLGVDFVFGAGSLFIARLALPYEQSMAGALFTAMTQVCFFFVISLVDDNNIPIGSSSLLGWHCIWDIRIDSCVQSCRLRKTARCGYDCQLSCCELDKCIILFVRYASV